MVGRSVPGWVGSSPDAKVPKAVRGRVFLAYGGKCYLSGRPIRVGDAWELEHVKPLSMGGLHAEVNLAPALKDAHKLKTSAEAGERAKCDRIHAKHYGYQPESKAKLQSRGFQKTRPPALRKSGFGD